MEATSPGTVCLFGAPLDTGNLGVEALGLSTIAALTRRLPDMQVVLFDHGRGVRARELALEGRHRCIEQRGAQISKRFYRGESLWTMYAAGRLSVPLNRNLRAIDKSAAVLDLSGGDSFTDLYSRKQRDLVTLPKRIALARGRPLYLLPQTYGPFRSRKVARDAIDLLARASVAWARDLSSFERLVDLLGSRFDSGRHRLGADVAFTLPATDPGRRVENLDAWMSGAESVIGLNISGLLFNNVAEARERFGLRCDYPAAMEKLLAGLLRETDSHILLVPHVHGSNQWESDARAARSLAKRFQGDRRIAVLEPQLRADEVKHVIGRMDWFMGARMHSTIAAISTRTPVAAVAYSDKFQGIFDGCGVGDRVYDARDLSTEEVVDALLDAWRHHRLDARRLEKHVPAVEAVAEQQFDDLGALLRNPDLEGQ